MKRFILLSLLIALTTIAVFGQNADYTKTMEEVVSKIQTSKWDDDLTPLANQLERIASVETKEWLPGYWAAYCYMSKSYQEPVKEKKDMYLEKAEKLLTAAQALNPVSDELEVMWANVANARMVVDPQNRWQMYGMLVQKHLAAAETINPGNPRSKLLEAEGVFFKPESFGGGKKLALPLIKETLERYEKFKPSSSIMPDWGKPVAEYMLSEAEK